VLQKELAKSPMVSETTLKSLLGSPNRERLRVVIKDLSRKTKKNAEKAHLAIPKTFWTRHRLESRTKGYSRPYILKNKRKLEYQGVYLKNSLSEMIYAFINDF